MQEKAARRAAERRIAVPRMKYITPVKPVPSWDETGQVHTQMPTEGGVIFGCKNHHRNERRRH